MALGLIPRILGALGLNRRIPPSTAVTQPDQPRRLARIGIGAGGAEICIHHHWLLERDGYFPCWTYVSAGLERLGQKEVALTVQRDPGESVTAFPPEVIGYFRLLNEFAKRGSFVDIGGVTHLAPHSAGLLHRPNFRGIIYAPGQSFDGVALPEPHLAAIVVTDQEFEVAMQYGQVRLMSILGERYRWFPTAPWADRHRPNITTMSEMESSLLARVGRIRVPGVRTYVLGPALSGRLLGRVGHLVDAQLEFGDREFVMELSERARELLATQLGKLSEAIPLAIISEPDPAADGCLWWRPGCDVGEARFIGPSGSLASHVSANHFCLNPEQGADTVGFLEGGFGFNLRTSSWQTIVHALSRGEPLRLELPSQETHLSVQWIGANA